MRRREFITLLGGAAVLTWPVPSVSQQPMPTVGFLRSSSRSDFDRILPAFLQGLREIGYVEGQNVTIEHRWADGEYDRLPALAADLVRNQVAVIVALSDPAALAAKTATSTIPVVFSTGSDPVELGLVSNFVRPDRNLTGLSQLNNALASKRLELVRELIPTAHSIAFLVNPTNPNTQANTTDIEAAAHLLGRQVRVFGAVKPGEIDAAFAAISQAGMGALLIASDPLLLDRRNQIVALAAQYRMPTFYTVRDYATAGGLICYAANQSDLYRQTGIYAGRILKGAKPSDLPVIQPTKFDLVINLRTAKSLGIPVPTSLFLLADEVIE